MSNTPEKQSFENAIGRLEHLVEQMEGEDMPLEQLLVNYEEGVKLVKVCQDKLAEAEKKIEIIQKKASGEVDLRSFEESSSPTPAKLGKVKEPKPSKDISLF